MSKKPNTQAKTKTNDNKTAPVTVATKEKQNRFEYVVVNIICLFAFLAFGYISVMGFFQTSVIDPTAYVGEHILYETDNIALNLFFAALFFVFLFAMRRFYNFFAKINMTVLEIILALYVVLLGMIWIFSVTSIPAADSQNIFETATQAANGQYTSLNDFTQFYNKDFYSGYSYYNFYPFQLGFVFFCELVYRIFGTDSSMPIQVLNVLATAAAYLGLAKITRILFKRKSVEFMAIFLLALCFQPILFCTFVYGNIIGMCLGIWACYFLIRYFQTNSWKLLIPCGILLVISTIVKYNNMIYLVAFVIMLIVHTIKAKKWQSIAFAVAICIATVGSSSLIIASYEARSGATLANGVSQVLYLDMGMQESSRAPGWYTTTGLNTYLKNGFDDEAANAEAWEHIGERMDKFTGDPEYMFDFYSKKILSQWNEPTFESIWVSKVKGHETEIAGGIGEAVYEKSLGQLLELHFGLYMRIVYLLFAVGIYLLFINKKTNICTVLLPLVLMGGFGYHFLCEGKSQYILTYIPLIIPTSAYALNTILCSDYKGAKKFFAKVNEIPSSFSSSSAKIVENGVPAFPNASVGINRIFTGEALALIGSVCALVASIFLYSNNSSPQVDTAVTTSAFDTSGMITIFFVLSALLLCAAFAFSLLGITRASKDEPIFKKALFIMLGGLSASIASAFLTDSVIAGGIIDIVIAALNLATILFVMKGVNNLADKLKRRSIITFGNKLLKGFAAGYLAIVVLKIVGMIAGVEVSGIVSAIIQIILCVAYLIFLSKANTLLLTPKEQ